MTVRRFHFRFRTATPVTSQHTQKSSNDIIYFIAYLLFVYSTTQKKKHLNVGRISFSGCQEKVSLHINNLNYGKDTIG